ncbi:MAG TPA: DeoR/GlpR family DNA-binding transcription regulator [Anaerolineaceae bacterium]|jgi:DeoR/GlpR family transcriptional regulator of sugar metabolism|nr:DeoR/GlpR family DNA-binding transcription regulator [Anaerolineaceae bacterium]HUM62390.1 DeoR/GlpR family DNA-binding transcription regulator [Anaerolineaceae bacterium]
MNVSERRDEILSYILNKNKVTISELKDKFEISLITVHRDLDYLESEGYIRKERGGAEIKLSGSNEKSLLLRSTQNTKAKILIAAYAKRFIHDDMTLLFDNSTTVLALAPHLIGFKNLMVVTYFEEIMHELSKPIYSCKLFCLGGEYSRLHRCYVGPFVDERLSSIHVDAAFISAAAMNPMIGTMQHFADESHRKKLILGSADETNLLIDNTKIMGKALFSSGALSRFRRIITNAPIEEDVIKLIKDTGVELHIVSPTQELQVEQQNQ